jgi:hypothetical protein
MLTNARNAISLMLEKTAKQILSITALSIEPGAVGKQMSMLGNTGLEIPRNTKRI